MILAVLCCAIVLIFLSFHGGRLRERAKSRLEAETQHRSYSRAVSDFKELIHRGQEGIQELSAALKEAKAELENEKLRRIDDRMKVGDIADENKRMYESLCGICALAHQHVTDDITPTIESDPT